MRMAKTLAALAVGVSVAVGGAVSVAVGAAVSVAVGAAVSVGVGLSVGVSVGVSVTVAAAVPVGVPVGEAVFERQVAALDPSEVPHRAAKDADVRIERRGAEEQDTDPGGQDRGLSAGRPIPGEPEQKRRKPR